MTDDSPVTESLCLERRSRLNLTDDQIEQIAERAASKAMEKITDQLYQEVGKAFVAKIVWIVGVLVVAATIWAHQKGWLEP